MKRFLLIGGGVAVVVVFAIAYFLYSSLDSIIAAAIEKYGSEYTGTAVAVGGVDLDLASGKGAITGFSIANPPGFATPKAIEVGRIALAVDIASVTADPIVIREIVIDKPKVTYELGADGNNIDTLADAIQSRTGSGDGTSPDQAAGKGGTDSGGGPKLIIEDLYVTGGEVAVSATALEGRTLGADLDNIHLRNIGKDEGGASTGKVARIIAAALVKWIGAAIETVDLGDVMKVIGGNVEGTPMKAKELGETLGKDAEKAGEKLKQLIK